MCGTWGVGPETSHSCCSGGHLKLRFAMGVLSAPPPASTPPGNGSMSSIPRPPSLCSESPSAWLQPLSSLEAPVSHHPHASLHIPHTQSLPELRAWPLPSRRSEQELRPRSPGASRRAPASPALPRSASASQLQDGSRLAVPHMTYLTPLHMRKGKGGRQPAADPRMDPRIDPKKARRILANRLSAAKSKLKQKGAAGEAGARLRRSSDDLVGLGPGDGN